jgi:hypothetical protein
MTSRLAALAGAIGESAAQKPLDRGELGDTGAEVALDSGQFDAAKRVWHLLYNYTIQERQEKQEQKNNENLLFDQTKAKNSNGIKCFG